MPTTVTKTIKSAGGDYSSLSAFEAGEQQDLVSNDRILQAECYAFIDTTEFVIDGWTTDATRYIRIFAASGEGHSGYWDTAKFLFRSVNALGVNIYEEYVRFEGIQFEHTENGSGYADGIRFTPGSTSSLIRFTKCLFKMIQSGASGVNSSIHGYPGVFNGGPIEIINCAFWDAYNTDFPDSVLPGGAVFNEFSIIKLYNCTFYKCVSGINAGGSSPYLVTAINCLSYCDELNANYTDFRGSGYTGSDYNASTDATAPGANSITNQASTDIDFESETETDAAFLALLSTSTCVGVGTDDPLSGVYSDDVRGQTRTSTWDIGADEFISDAGSILLFVARDMENIADIKDMRG